MEFIDRLIEQVNFAIAKAKEYQKIDSTALTHRASLDSWNALECLEHLNRYGEFYLPEIEKSIKKSDSPPAKEYKSGWLGAYLAKSMEPRENVNKVKTFKSKNPLNSDLNKEVIQAFIDQQYKTLELLEDAKRVNINTVRVKTSISSLLRLRLGDTFLFMINHVLRHLKQADTALLKA